MSEDKRVFLWTIIATVLLCLELILISLTPFAKVGNGIEFNNTGMHKNLIMVGGSYLIPLLLYSQKVKSMKYVIAIVNGVWLISQPVIVMVALQWIKCKVAHGEFICGILVVIVMITFIIEILWYFMCRRRKL